MVSQVPWVVLLWLLAGSLAYTNAKGKTRHSPIAIIAVVILAPILAWLLPSSSLHVIGWVCAAIVTGLLIWDVIRQHVSTKANEP
jgi:uncharacterized membrane protein